LPECPQTPFSKEVLRSLVSLTVRVSIAGCLPSEAAVTLTFSHNSGVFLESDTASSPSSGSGGLDNDPYCPFLRALTGPRELFRREGSPAPYGDYEAFFFLLPENCDSAYESFTDETISLTSDTSADSYDLSLFSCCVREIFPS